MSEEEKDYLINAISEYINNPLCKNSDCIEMFKHGVADGLLEGTRDESKNDSHYKQGYDYGITLYGRLENLE